jgi:GNAT superfamily N-acetyltransferase
MTPVTYSDRALSQKLERAEARANVDFVVTRARVSPESGAAWIDVAGAYAMFDGVASPLTQTFGLGIFDPVGAKELDLLERFFTDRGAPVFHEVSPMADAGLMPLLNERGYHPVELSTVLFRTLTEETPFAATRGVEPRLIDPSEGDLWARISAEAWAAEGEELGDFMRNFGRINIECSGSYPFIGELDGRPIATGMLFIYDDVAILAGASTLPKARRRGAQNALLDARLRFAREHGCTIAMMAALPGSQSQKNAQKNGFQIAYTRTKWQLGHS